jgi:hypothetical protein
MIEIISIINRNSPAARRDAPCHDPDSPTNLTRPYRSNSSPIENTNPERYERIAQIQAERIQNNIARIF